MKRPFLDVLKSNIQQVLANFNQKEIYIIEHLLGSMGELLSSEEIAANLKVTKVNITFRPELSDVKTQFT
jgi:DNA-directed RNA polymerase sigma subunit (sigma70/sigma32)